MGNDWGTHFKDKWAGVIGGLQSEVREREGAIFERLVPLIKEQIVCNQYNQIMVSL